MCRCASLSTAEEAVPTREAFVATFDRLETSDEQWAELMRCRDCGQVWKVEVHAEYDRRTNHAFKLASIDDWLEFDMTPARAALLLRLLGGTSSTTCMQAGCTARAVANRAFCILHLDTGYRL